MSFVLVLVAADDDNPLQESHIEAAVAACRQKYISIDWLAPGKAAELVIKTQPTRSQRDSLEQLLRPDRIDAFLVPNDGRRKKKLLISDMDNTMVVGETLDDLAESCGLKEQVAVITDKAMRGELNFQKALETRVAMLKGLKSTALEETMVKVKYMKGAKTLVQTMRRHGALCVLVSGGFTSFTEPVAKELGFEANHGNVLELESELLTGKVCPPILNHQSKLDFLHHYAKQYDIDSHDCLAVGDGANDLAMISAAGLGVGFHPKPYLKERIDNSILHGDLTALLYVQGYRVFS